MNTSPGYARVLAISSPDRKVVKWLISFLFGCVLLFSFTNSRAQNAFKEGEYLQYQIQYGLLKAGYASLEVQQMPSEDQELLLAVGKGWTTGMVGLIFPVEDRYETVFDKTSGQPVRFLRKIDEGGYTQHKEILFDLDSYEARVINHKKETDSVYFAQRHVQDMLSSFYYLRNVDLSDYKEGDRIRVLMFFDEEMYPVDLRILGRETIKTRFGKVATVKLQPIVQKGRVFKDEENVVMWVTDDENKIPVKIKASILVGAVKAELSEYRGLKHAFP